MEVVLKARGAEITDRVRHLVERKFAKLSRRPNPPVLRLEVELTEERNPRVAGHHRARVTCETARRTFRAEGAGPDLETALDRASERLTRQVDEYRTKRAALRSRPRVRLESEASTGPVEPSD